MLVQLNNISLKSNMICVTDYPIVIIYLIRPTALKLELNKTNNEHLDFVLF